MSAPVPVFTLIDSLYLDGGAERLALDVAARLDRSCFTPVVCVTRAESDEPSATEEAGKALLAGAGVELLRLPRRGRADVAPWRTLVAALRARRAGVLHAHKFGSNVWGSIVGPLARVPAVVSHEHTWAYDNRARMLADRHVVARGSHAVVAVSQEDRRRMIELEHMPAARVRYIPNGIVRPPAGDGARVRAELGVDDTTPLVGAVGALRAQKAFTVLVEAAAELRDRVPGVRVVIAGDGDERGRLEERISALGLGDVVTILGYRADVPDVVAALDVVVNCSDFEGQPLSILEAMEAARPIVATAVGGTPDLLDDGDGGCGVLVPPRDPGAIADAVAGLLAEPERAAALGARARERRRREFDISVVVGRISALYDELLDAAARRAT